MKNLQINMKTKILYFLVYIVLSINIVIIVYPLIWVFMGSLKTNEQLFLDPWGIPDRFNIGVYKKVLYEYGLGSNLLNSLELAIITVVISAVICMMASYCISRMKWKLSKLVMGFFLLGIMIPVHSTLIPLYINIHGLINIFGAKGTILIPYIAFTLPTSIFILTGFMQTLPYELEEAAILDGCSILSSFARIIVPLSIPAIATVSIFNFLSVWNELLFGIVFLSKNRDQTLPVGLMKFFGAFGSQWGEILATISIAIIPSIIVYISFQEKIIKGITAGAMKG